jgi:hypothetical protein
MSQTQITTISFFRYTTPSNKWWAFKLMGQAVPDLEKVKGLQFVKMMGSGAGNGFSIWPNFGTYGLLCVWDEEATARHFFEANPIFKECKQKSEAWWTVFMQAAHFHGEWDGTCPFTITTPFDKKKPVAVITRATIATKKLWQFWRFVPSVGKSVENKPGMLFSIGIGELPLVQQATFSLWEDSEKMMAYAYDSAHHKEVVRKTRELGWYTEELFARFHPYDVEGKWDNDRTPIDNFILKNASTQ